ncbi:BQ2448_6496 [Microbotryum intermedium]|uniref:BQ2448_6496 protein n=1 Tax=Microbotryum intermedium TaxID=269621 RepID=A0A238FQA3_9BASI|nr:BQ2448_6496 [Microbotryum intermedium]
MAGATYNVTRFTRQVLKRYRKEPPSLVLHLYNTHFRFEQQHGNFNYDSPMKCFLEAIREQKLPTDLLDVLDEAGVRYYEGCLIVEVHDHRDQSYSSAAPAQPSIRPGLALSFQLGRQAQPVAQSRAEVYRIVLGPNPATLWTELGIMDRRIRETAEENAAEGGVESETLGWTEEEAVEIEAIILARTTAPLCLSPSLQTSRIANSMLRATTPRPPKRKRSRAASEGEAEEDGEDVLRREREEHEKMMKLGDEGVSRGRGHAFARLAFIQSYRERQNNPQDAVQAGPSAAATAGNGGGNATTSSTAGAAQSPTNVIRITTPVHQIPPSGASTPRTAGSPPASISDRKKKMPIDIAASTADDASEAGTPESATLPATSAAAVAHAASTKKAKKIAAQSVSSSVVDPTLPSDPAEREKVLEARQRAQANKKRQENKLRKEKRKLEKEKQLALANDVKV